MITKITNGRIVAKDEILSGFHLYFRDGEILEVTPEEVVYPVLVLDATVRAIDSGKAETVPTL